MADGSEQILKEILLSYDSKGGSRAQKTMRDLSKGAEDVKSKVNGVVGSLEELAVAFGAAAGVKKGLSTFLDLNKALIQGSAQFSKYGIGIGKVEKQMESLSSTVGITRQNSLELFSLYEKGIPMASIKGFENVMKNIVKVTGASVSAQKEYLNLVSNISNKLPSLQGALENIGDVDASRIDSLTKSLVLTGQLDLVTAKQLRNYAQANKQNSKSDQDKLKRNLEVLESQKRINRAFEDLSLQIGKAILPYMESFSKFLKDNEKLISSLVGKVAKLAVVIGIATAGFKIIKGTVGIIASTMGGITKAAASLKGSKGLSGRIAG